jgi:YVTN family beta-propeller protein
VALALSPDGGLLVVSNHYWDSISLLDPATLVGQARIEVGKRPAGLAFSADGSRLYVINKDAATLSVVDVASRQVMNTIAGLAGHSEHITLSPDGMKAYVTGYNSGGIDEVNLGTGQVTRLRELENPGKPAFAPDGSLYVPAKSGLWRRNGDGSWSALSVSGGYIDHVLFSPDGRYAYLSLSWENRVRIVDLVLGRQVHSLAVQGDPHALARTSDGRLLMVANGNAGTVQIIDGLTFATLQTVEMPGSWPAALVWDEARKRLYVADTHAGQVRSVSLVYGNAAGNTQADVSGDGDVDVEDAQMVAEHWRSEGNSTEYDLNNDGQVNIADLMLVVFSMTNSP